MRTSINKKLKRDYEDLARQAARWFDASENGGEPRTIRRRSGLVITTNTATLAQTRMYNALERIRKRR